MNEIWKNIKGYENEYQVSNKGRVRSKDKIVVFKDGRERLFKGCLRKLAFNKKRGYYYVSFKVSQKVKTYAVHRLVAETFMPINSDKLVVDHIDKNRLNNNLNNLRWVTARFNLSRNSLDDKGSVGYCWHKSQNKWISSIYINGKINHLGYFTKEENAKNAYLKALQNV